MHPPLIGAFVPSSLSLDDDDSHNEITAVLPDSDSLFGLTTSDEQDYTALQPGHMFDGWITWTSQF